jgi:UDP-N-acetylmuramoyl-tripeptide--D-alanyl-D-alanine ligase
MQIEELYDIYKKYPSVQTDTRHLKQGDVFFALKGGNFNGNAFARQAVDSGAAYAVIDETEFEIPGKTILVDDSLTTLQDLAKYHREQFKIPFIAITGSNGKTTTKELIHVVLSSSFKTYTTEGNLNNHIGIPLTILKIKPDAEIAVIEMGANHIGEIAGYCKYTQPTHGLITNCGKAHLEGFGSIEGVKKGKGELFDHLRTLTHGFAFVMWDYDYMREMSKGISGIIKYGTNEEAHIIGKVKQSNPYLEVEIVQGLNNGLIKTQLVGDYNLPNVLAAVTVGKTFKVDEEKIKTAIENYFPSNSRSQLIERGSNKIILDAYNANPASMKLAIENFARMKASNKILILGAMAELGTESLQEHQLIIDLIKKYDWKNVVLVGGDFTKLQHPFISFNSAIEAKHWLHENKPEDAYILVKGSRSMQMEKVIDEHKAYFADQTYNQDDVIENFSASQVVSTPSYLTIQVDRDKHIMLKPEKLQDINHSCNPNVFFDTDGMQLVALRSVKKGDELTYFYPSTEWDMAQPFTCHCGSGNCLKEIKGALYISEEILNKYRLSSFIQRQLQDRHVKDKIA